MGSQFVDLNADGHLDYLSATFDGSPHVSYGSAAGFGAPEHLKDARGERILISSIWDYEAEEHRNLGRAMPDGEARDERCISALAFDWDADGDHDLLLGSYENGHLYRQMNEGSDKEPKFTGRNIPVLAGDAPFALPAKMTAPRLVDWDGDGDPDLLAGTFGDDWGPDGTGGGVYLSRNGGSKGNPSFGALETLIAPAQSGGTEPTRPNAGLYADAVDYDGDGDLDLVVGGYSLWTPAGRALTPEEETAVAGLREQMQGLQQEYSALMQKIEDEAKKAAEGLDPKSKEHRAKWSAAYEDHGGEIAALEIRLREVSTKIEALVPSGRREPFVWWYERL